MKTFTAFQSFCQFESLYELKEAYFGVFSNPESVIKGNNSLETRFYGNCFTEREDLSKKNCHKFFLMQLDL